MVYSSCMTTIAELKDLAGLAELLKQVEAGNEVLITHNDQPVARLVPLMSETESLGRKLRYRSISGHRVLTPDISQSDLADELLGRQ